MIKLKAVEFLEALLRGLFIKLSSSAQGGWRGNYRLSHR